ncbi:unnamed protein product [Tilletia laevis]|uniref:Transmembrane protein n=2 Tax=Tilletia TaxID=13289 RepID=A0A9N8MDY9_9BASI|nr:hypothetical protein CF335_g8005 [Tilletia laevis]CAD6944103.1 unnamed protein product [Tilletia caries]CAD6961886.1 unnamed protein product [Tilletia laevis]CAD7060902.1 unnamed protein product [Tilletia caries]
MKTSLLPLTIAILTVVAHAAPVVPSYYIEARMFHERGEVVNPQEVAKVAQSAGKVSKKVLFYGALGGASLMWIIDHPREPPPYWKTKPSSTPSPTPPSTEGDYD